MSDYEEIPPPGFEWITYLTVNHSDVFYFLGVIRIAIPIFRAELSLQVGPTATLQLLCMWFTATGWGSIPFARVDRWFGGSYST